MAVSPRADIIDDESVQALINKGNTAITSDLEIQEGGVAK
jgi:hypothetical protein